MDKKVQEELRSTQGWADTARMSGSHRGEETGDVGGGCSAGDMAGDTHLYGRRFRGLALCSHLFKPCWM